MPIHLLAHRLQTPNKFFLFAGMSGIESYYVYYLVCHYNAPDSKILPIFFLLSHPQIKKTKQLTPDKIVTWAEAGLTQW